MVAAFAALVAEIKITRAQASQTPKDSKPTEQKEEAFDLWT